MTLPSVDPKDFAAAGKLLQDLIGELQRVIVGPAVTQATEAVEAGVHQTIVEAIPAMGAQIQSALAEIPSLAGGSADKVLNELEGLTLTTTFTMTNVLHRAKKP